MSKWIILKQCPSVIKKKGEDLKPSPSVLQWPLINYTTDSRPAHGFHITQLVRRTKQAQSYCYNQLDFLNDWTQSSTMSCRQSRAAHKRVLCVCLLQLTACFANVWLRFHGEISLADNDTLLRIAAEKSSSMVTPAQACQKKIGENHAHTQPM